MATVPVLSGSPHPAFCMVSSRPQLSLEIRISFRQVWGSCSQGGEGQAGIRTQNSALRIMQEGSLAPASASLFGGGYQEENSQRRPLTCEMRDAHRTKQSLA